MSCLFNLFSKNLKDSECQGQNLPRISEAQTTPKPTFCIYDSDDSDVTVPKIKTSLKSEWNKNGFPLLESFQLYKHEPISLPPIQIGLKQTTREFIESSEVSPERQPCYTISPGYQECFLADTFFVYLSLHEQDHKPQEQEKRLNHSCILSQIEMEKSEMNFDKNLPFIPQSKFPKIRKFSVTNQHSHIPHSGPARTSGMGNSDSKLSFQRAVEQLGTNGPVEASDVAVWDQLCQESLSSIDDVFSLLSAEEIRALREDSPANLSTLCYKVRKIVGFI